MTGVAYIGVGSNIGDAFENCVQGIRKVIHDERAAFIALSSFYRTSPVSPIAQDDFLNCALKITWGAGPPELLSFLHEVEGALGRTRDVKFGPRTLDLDILLFDDLVLDTPALTIPHPRLHERRFVLVPCLEIEPRLVHPRLKRPLAEYLDQIGPEQKIEFFRRISVARIEADRPNGSPPFHST
ncbi:MAG: 2-amino-4-hydroxy-6-hydroxymethyldihydropteridine diphosphokinase [Syntrophorhabdales bacterium]|jgi:2-amino-4-hydroxy-6-hydroxymethyldihydropteridine diphosphokinase